MKKIRGKFITDQSEVEYILSIKQSEITMTLLKELFANTAKGDARFNTNDAFILPANRMYNSVDVETTVGKYIFNLLLLYPVLHKHIGYQNQAFTKGEVEDLDGKVADLLIDGKIQAEDQITYINKMNWLGYGANKFLVQSLTYDLFDPIDEILQKRDELFAKHQKAIDKGDVVIASEIEGQLVKLAQELAKDRIGMEIFQSGAGKKFGNNYKNMSISRGPIKDMSSSEDKYFISKNNLVNGIPKEEFHYYADLPVLGSYSRAINTRDGGYQKKILEASFQSEQVDKPGTDCGSKGYLNLKITKGNSKSLIYRYIIGEKGELVRLNPDTLSSYIGKTVKLRSPMFCVNDKYCSKCAGDLFEKIDIQNVGLLTPRIGTRLLNTALKAFHDSTIKISKLDIDDFIIENK